MIGDAVIHMRDRARWLHPAWRRAKLVAVVTVLGVALLAPTSVAHAARTVAIGTAGVMGLYYPLGNALCRMVNVTRKVHGLRCSVETSEGSVANIERVLAGDLDMGIAQGDTQYFAYHGSGPFAGKPQSRLRTLFGVYPETFTLVAREASGIRSIQDLRGKRVGIGTAGSGTRATMDLVLEAAGLRREDLRAALDTKIVEMAPMLCENRMDAFGFVAGHPNAVFQDATVGCRTRIVPVEGPGIDALLVSRPYYMRASVPGGMYQGSASAQPTIGTMTSIVVSADMSEEVAYGITRAVFEAFDDFRKLHPALASLTKQQAVTGNVVPFHPGAERYFREAGLQ